MPVQSPSITPDATVQPGIELRFDVIKQHAARKLGLEDAGKVTQEQIAELLGLSHKQINRFKMGHALPSLETAAHISNTFGIPIEAFILDPHRTYVR